ncbi:transporter substrate-binding domain-containing protein [Ureibacillus acetophenoni]|uniref:Amino acid ABC transporter substrate-binding protein (PAAT family) n=1 Tax=Ureibacillus acetophenoni TaxID=614649 RepID=A0A285UQC6_9BACL|nr:transporter substrate-binding domain-containing protein [Ureibacillus acetophenoni]SOC43598.1 amino acid ABC transporter substrate-binding protein (PAAT family) [Ureibacillus acetophenoni]
MKKSLLVLVVALFAVVLAACGSNNESGNSSDSGKPVYRVGIDTTYPPFEYEQDGKYVGIDVDLIQAIAEDQGFEVKLEAMDFKGIIPALQAGQLDISMGGMSITEERKKIVDFTEPYFDAGVSLVVSKDNTEIQSVEDLKGKKVAVKKGTVGANYADSIVNDIGFEIIQFDDSPSMFLEVQNGNAAALFEDYPVISYAIAQQDLGLQVVGDRLNDDQYGIGVLKGENQEILEKINQGLKNLKENGKYQEIIDKYLAN